ncbi:MAG TPA: tRNA lysidine(34) synthetase TilS, partial [Methylomicrobium sp.]|nr:tRNA lysidine(34) synthetase TilS [Methylomicrobium sp.]
MLTPRLIELSLSFCKEPPRRVYVAYSGGVDSHVLLHLCAEHQGLREKLTAVHVHHGLQSQAEAWARHAEAIARNLGVKFLLLRVAAQANKGESPEEAARNARYAALKQVIAEGEVLLVAQHLDDQLETVLLQLFRGSGLAGLSGMPESMSFGRGMLLRPLLYIRKQAIDAYASAQNLHWIEDPSNQDHVFDRNFLRQQVLPLLKQRWPSMDLTVARAAGHCGESQRLLSSVAAEAFRNVYEALDDAIDLDRLAGFDDSRQRLIIRHWIQRIGLKMPSQAFLKQLFTNVIHADRNRVPVLGWQGYQFRRYRGKLYCLKTCAEESLHDLLWPANQISLRYGNGMSLTCVPAQSGLPQKYWQHSNVTVRFRSGGETIALPGRQGRH